MKKSFYELPDFIETMINITNEYTKWLDNTNLKINSLRDKKYAY